MDSTTHQNTNPNPNQRKRNAILAFSDQDHGNRVQVMLQHVSPATRNRQLSSPANHNNNNGGLGFSSGCHEPGTTAETSTAAAATPVVKAEITGHIENTFASLESLPIGYRFVPTDEELVTHYLLRKIYNQDLPRNKIGDVDIYENHPEKIVENHPQAKEGQWLFFSPRNRKYNNGSRPDRKAGHGYWKATGPDKEINNDNGVKIGDKKSLVYHEGHAPKGIKTDWVMHEYVAVGYQRQRLDKNDMKLDDCVLCKIYKKENKGRRQINQVVSDHQHQQRQSKIQDENPTTVDHGKNNVHVISDSTNQDHIPRLEEVEEVRAPIPDQEPRSKKALLRMVSEPNPRNFQFNNNAVVQNSNSLSYYCHPSMGILQNSLSNCDMRFAQPVAPTPYHPFSSGSNYMINNVPFESGYNATLDFNRPGYINQQRQPLQVAAPTYQTADVGAGLWELDCSEDDLNNNVDSLGFHELDHLNRSESKQNK